MNKFSYVTLATEDKYLDGAYNLYLTYKKTNSKYPFLCMVWQNVNYSQYPDMPIIVVSKIHRLDTFLGEWTRILSKINLWDLLDYEYVLFLDADILFYKNIDNLIDKYLALNIKDNQILGCPVNTDGIERCWGGMLFLHPNLKAFNTAISYISDYYTDEDLLKILAINKDIDFVYDKDIANQIYHFPNQVQDNKLYKYWQTEKGKSMFLDFLNGNKTIEDLKQENSNIVFEYGTQT